MHIGCSANWSNPSLHIQTKLHYKYKKITFFISNLLLTHVPELKPLHWLCVRLLLSINQNFHWWCFVLKILLQPWMYLLFISPSPGGWEARMHVLLLFSNLFPGDMCSLFIPCSFQTQLVIPSPSYYYSLQNYIGWNKNICKGYFIDQA